MPKAKHEPGERFGRLTYLGEAPSDGRRRCWFVSCDCGSRVVIRRENIICGDTSSCGCLHREQASKMLRTHGQTRTKEHRAWESMKARCLNKNNKFFEDYGGRGIKVSPRWLNSFESFYGDVGPAPSSKHSIDRIDVNGNYEPGNVRWATWKVQNNNKRISKKFIYMNETKSLHEWASQFKVKYGTLWYRLNKGLPLDQALTLRVK